MRSRARRGGVGSLLVLIWFWPERQESTGRCFGSGRPPSAATPELRAELLTEIDWFDPCSLRLSGAFSNPTPFGRPLTP